MDIFFIITRNTFQKKNIKSLDKILDIAARHGKKFSMEWSSGWYVYSFLAITGLTVGLMMMVLPIIVHGTVQKGISKELM